MIVRTNDFRLFCRTAMAGLALAAGLVTPGPACAQTLPSTTAMKKVTLNLVQQPVQTALRLLFSNAGFNSSIDQDVQGYATINVSDVSFEVALRALLNAANPPLTYDVNGGVYHVFVKRDTFIPPVVTAPQQSQTAEGIHSYRIPINHYDAGLLAQISAAAGGRGGVIVIPPNNVTTGSGQGGAAANSGGGGLGGGRGGRRGGG